VVSIFPNIDKALQGSLVAQKYFDKLSFILRKYSEMRRLTALPGNYVRLEEEEQEYLPEIDQLRTDLQDELVMTDKQLKFGYGQIVWPYYYT